MVPHSTVCSGCEHQSDSPRMSPDHTYHCRRDMFGSKSSCCKAEVRHYNNLHYLLIHVTVLRVWCLQLSPDAARVHQTGDGDSGAVVRINLGGFEGPFATSPDPSAKDLQQHSYRQRCLVLHARFEFRRVQQTYKKAARSSALL